MVRGCLSGWVELCVCVSDTRFIQFALGCAHKRIVRVYIERGNMKVELIRFRKQISPVFTFTSAKPGNRRGQRVYAGKVVTT